MHRDATIVSFVYETEDFVREIDVKSSCAIIESGEQEKERGTRSCEPFRRVGRNPRRKGGGKVVAKEPSADVAGNPCVRPTELAVAHLAVSVFALHFARILERSGAFSLLFLPRSSSTLLTLPSVHLFFTFPLAAAFHVYVSCLLARSFVSFLLAPKAASLRHLACPFTISTSPNRYLISRIGFSRPVNRLFT